MNMMLNFIQSNLRNYIVIYKTLLIKQFPFVIIVREHQLCFPCFLKLWEDGELSLNFQLDIDLIKNIC